MSVEEAVVVVGDSVSGVQARALATTLGLPFLKDSESLPREIRFSLQYLSQGLSLCEHGSNVPSPTRVDFYNPQLEQRVRDSIRQQNLIKALGLKKSVRPSILDAMAGLGKDGFLMASTGCSVLMLEQSKVVHALLEDGLQRLSSSNRELSSQLALRQADFMQGDFGMNEFDIVYLDPMYPGSDRKSKAKKDMNRLHDLLGNASDKGEESEQLAMALEIARKRVTVKRPKNAPDFAEVKPQLVYKGSSARFDVYLTA